jgi:hypothetical protein
MFCESRCSLIELKHWSFGVHDGGTAHANDATNLTSAIKSAITPRGRNCLYSGSFFKEFHFEKNYGRIALSSWHSL